MVAQLLIVWEEFVDKGTNTQTYRVLFIIVRFYWFADFTDLVKWMCTNDKDNTNDNIKDVNRWMQKELKSNWAQEEYKSCIKSLDTTCKRT